MVLVNPIKETRGRRHGSRFKSGNPPNALPQVCTIVNKLAVSLNHSIERKPIPESLRYIFSLERMVTAIKKTLKF